jgi:hypothetical protein
MPMICQMMICQIWTLEMQIANLLFASWAALAEHAPIVYASPIEFRLNDLASPRTPRRI